MRKKFELLNKHCYRAADNITHLIKSMDYLELTFSLTHCIKLALHQSQSWIISCMRKADKNHDNMMSLKEVKHFLRQINIEVDDVYAAMLFQVRSICYL